MHTTPRVRAVLDTPSLPLRPLPTCTPSSIASIVIANFVVLSGRWCTQDIALVSGRCGGRWRRRRRRRRPLPRPHSPSNSTSRLMWHCCRHTGRRSMHTYPCTPLPAHRSHTYTPWYPFGRLAATRNTSLRMCAWSWEGAWGCSTGRDGVHTTPACGRGRVRTQGQAGGIRLVCTPTA